jgi:hypothetical protein
MKTTQWICGILAAGVIGLVGCRKSDETPAPPPGGAPTVDVGKLRQAFPTAEGEVQNCLTKIRNAVRYSDYPTAMSELEKLAADAKLTEAQKKVVNDLMEQVKQAVAGDLKKALPGAK